MTRTSLVPIADPPLFTEEIVEALLRVVNLHSDNGFGWCTGCGSTIIRFEQCQTRKVLGSLLITDRWPPKDHCRKRIRRTLAELLLRLCFRPIGHTGPCSQDPPWRAAPPPEAFERARDNHRRANEEATSMPQESHSFTAVEESRALTLRVRCVDAEFPDFIDRLTATWDAEQGWWSVTGDNCSARELIIHPYQIEGFRRLFEAMTAYPEVNNRG